MDRTTAFRRRLRDRLVLLAGASLPAAGCGGVVVVDGGEGGSGGTGGSSSAVTGVTSVTATSSSGGGTSSVGSSSGQSGVSTSSGGPSTGSGPPPLPLECFAWMSATPCPSLETAAQYMDGQCMDPDWIYKQPAAGPYPIDGSCCYEVLIEGCAVPGRPLVVDGRPLTATARAAAATFGEAAALAPRLDALSSSDRATLAEAWASDALLEHASIASFARFSLELLAHGAPAHLVEAAHRAALDEIRHAELCFALAGAFAGRPLAPSALPLGASLSIAADLAALAESTVREGCVGETLAALVAAEQLAGAEDSAVRAALSVIAEDEARHAELAWSTVRWALEVGGAPVREAVKAAFTAAQASVAAGEGSDEADVVGPLSAQGRLARGAAERIARLAFTEVIAPSAEALLAARS